MPTDAMLASCGVPYVSLQNGFYAESALYQLRGLKDTGKLVLPADGPVSWTARADLAEAAVLLGPGVLADGPSPALTAVRPLWSFWEIGHRKALHRLLKAELE